MTDLTLFLHALTKASYLCGMVPFPVLLLGWLWPFIAGIGFAFLAIWVITGIFRRW